MAYLLRNLLFIHLPKTGGHSVWDVMKPRGGIRLKTEWGPKWIHHQSAAGLKARLGPSYDQYEKFSLIRNPFERAVSLYFGRDKKNYTPSVAGFKKFMRNRRGLAKFRWNPYYPQVRFAGVETKLFDLDNINGLFEWLGDQLGEEIMERPWRKTGMNRNLKRLPWRQYYDDEIVSWVREDCAVELEQFGWNY